MQWRIGRNWKRLGIATSALGALALIAWGSTETAKEPGKGSRAVAAAPLCRDSSSLPDPAKPQLGCPAPPNTFDGSSFFGDGATPASRLKAGPTVDAWAWASFAAFNWPAKADATQPIGYLRGIPDLGKTFAGAQNTDVLVWETLKEKREIFNKEVKAGQWQDLTFSVDQALDFQVTPSGMLGKVPACTPTDLDQALALGSGHHRRVLQASKLAPSLDGDNTTDETAEVASPPQEAQNTLCAGYTGALLATCQGYFPNAPAKSSSDPFPPTIPNPRKPVGPRVYEVTGGHILYYEVKLNYDYYNFITAPPNLPNGNPPPGTYNFDKIAYPVARTKQLNLPYRTSSNTTPNITSPQPPLSVLSYDANAAATAFAGLPVTPPAYGAVQIKTGWQLLGTNPTVNATFHVTDAIYFSTDPSAPPENVCYRVGKFGLVGIHIIQRVHLGSAFNTAQPTGGTYIYATWEHNSVGSGTGYRYTNFLADLGAEQANPIPFPALTNTIQVQRKKPYPLASTQQVTSAVWSQLPASSVWKNYRLIGTQFLAVDSEAQSLQYNQPYFLANLLIETNDGLQHFEGLPPGVTPVYSGFKPTTTSFEPSYKNVSSNGNAVHMGGCMGCHGVAQLNGYNFSFVFQDGTRGAGIDTLTHVAIPPLPPGTGTTAAAKKTPGKGSHR